MAEDIPGTQIQSQLLEDSGSDSNGSDNEPKRRMSRLKSNRREDDDSDGFSDDLKERNDNGKSDDDDDDEGKNSSDNDGSGSGDDDDDDLFGDNEIEEEEEKNREKPSNAQKRKRISKTDSDNVTAASTAAASAAAAPHDFLSEIEEAKKIELVQQHLPPTNRKGYLIRFPPSVGVQRHVYDRQKYEKRDPQKFLAHTIRWRRAPGNRAVRESNTRLVRWSDNSYTLHIGATVIPLGASRLQGFHYMAIRSNGRVEPHTSMSQRLNVFVPQDVLASAAAKSRTTIAKLVDDTLLDINNDKLGTATEESRSKESHKRRPSLGGELGEEYDNEINDDQSEKNSADSIRDAKKPKKRQKK